MRDVLKTEELVVPEGVEVTIKSRLITVTGPRGTIKKNVRHVDMDIRVVKSVKAITVTFAVWQGGRKHVACLRTIKSMVANMITGVTKVRSRISECFVRGSILDRAAGLLLQNARCICPFPHQLHHPERWIISRDP